MEPAGYLISLTWPTGQFEFETPALKLKKVRMIFNNTPVELDIMLDFMGITSTTITKFSSMGSPP